MAQEKQTIHQLLDLVKSTKICSDEDITLTYNNDNWEVRISYLFLFGFDPILIGSYESEVGAIIEVAKEFGVVVWGDIRRCCRIVYEANAQTSAIEYVDQFMKHPDYKDYLEYKECGQCECQTPFWKEEGGISECLICGSPEEVEQELEKELPPHKLEVGVYFQMEDGKAVFDEDEMRNEFEAALKQLEEKYS